MNADPLTLFDTWLAEAEAAEPNDPNAMSVATVDAAGRPSSRMVLLKGHDDRGFVFYTNQESRKAGELLANPLRGVALSLEVAPPPGADRRDA